MGGHTGEGAASALAGAVLALARDPRRVRELGEAARATAEARYSPLAFRRRYAAIYRWQRRQAT